MFNEFADIYAALGHQGISQKHADETQLQVIAAMLGLHKSDNDQHEGESLIAARIRHAKGDGPKPEAKAPSAGQMGALMARARGG